MNGSTKYLFVACLISLLALSGCTTSKMFRDFDIRNIDKVLDSNDANDASSLNLIEQKSLSYNRTAHISIPTPTPVYVETSLFNDAFPVADGNITGVSWTKITGVPDYKTLSDLNLIFADRFNFGVTWTEYNNILPLLDGNVANDITLDNITQITSRNHHDLNGLSDDDHPQYLNEERFESQDFNVLGAWNFEGGITYSVPHMYGLKTTIETVPVAGVWNTIDFNAEICGIHGLTFIDSNTVVIPSNGHYSICFGAGFQDASPAPDSQVGMRLTRNSSEIPGSYVEFSIIKQDIDIWVEHFIHLELEENDKIVFQFIASDTDVTLKQSDTYATQPFNAFGYIRKIG